MALEGLLSEFGVKEIFQRIHQQSKTGILTIHSGEETITVSFQEGKIVAANSSVKNPNDRIGNILVRTKMVDAESLKAAINEKEESLDRIGQILLKKKVITKEVLQKALQVQVLQIIKRLFSVEDGFYHFKPEEKVHYDEENMHPISIDKIISVGVEKAPVLEELSGKMPSADDVYEKTYSLDDEEANLIIDELDDENKDVLKYIDGWTTIKSILEKYQDRKLEVLKIITELEQKGLIRKLLETKTPIKIEVKKTKPIKLPKIYIIPYMVVPIIIVLVALGLKDLYNKGVKQFTLVNNPIYRTLENQHKDRVFHAVNLYINRNNNPPISVDFLVRARYLQQKFAYDPWGNMYILRVNDNTFSLISKGADGKVNTGDDLIYTKEFNKETNIEAAFFPFFPQYQSLEATP